MARARTPPAANDLTMRGPRRFAFPSGVATLPANPNWSDRMSRLTALASALLALFHPLAARAVNAGDPAPAFSSPATGGKTLQLSDFKGKWLALYFYPKADTPGCTKESCSLRDGYQDLLAAGVQIVGSSTDNVAAQEAFKTKYNLPFDLLADTTKAVARSFNSLGLGGLMSSRKTFLINPEGVVVHVFDKVDVASHSAQILAKVKELQAAAKSP
jgi:peroxiredoxin Q/BCP